MSLIVIGGHSRNVGKTSVVAGLIAALPEYNWTAFKITQYGHGICSKDGQPCDCVTDDHSWAVSEEKDRSGHPTVRVFWWRVQFGHGGCALSRDDWQKRCPRFERDWLGPGTRSWNRTAS